ncbi:MAG TPA: GxxExxY protein [Bacteroidia bacterium]|nr:GxxExxY protein [Bacteroidia bacterium]
MDTRISNIGTPEYNRNVQFADHEWLVADEERNYKSDKDVILKDEIYELVGLCMDVHRTLGSGFSEILYKDALEKELQWKGISYQREVKFVVNYKGYVLPHHYCADFVIGGNIILEAKAQVAIPEQFYAQIINYLAVSKCPVGLLVNFGDVSLRYKRVVLTK